MKTRCMVFLAAVLLTRRRAIPPGFQPDTGRVPTFMRYRYDAGNTDCISDNKVLALAEDSQGDLWIGTTGGLERLALGALGLGDMRERAERRGG